jgi:hypothetical protein
MNPNTCNDVSAKIHRAVLRHVFYVRAQNHPVPRYRKQALAYVYFEEEPGRRAAAHLLTRAEARRITANIAKLPTQYAGGRLSEASRAVPALPMTRVGFRGLVNPFPVVDELTFEEFRRAMARLALVREQISSIEKIPPLCPPPR